VKQLSVPDAPALLAEGAVYLDVRTTAEFNQGHPMGALNVPLFEPDEDTGAMEPNPDFVRVVQANVPREATLLVGCQAGGRSLRAASVLEPTATPPSITSSADSAARAIRWAASSPAGSTPACRLRHARRRTELSRAARQRGRRRVIRHAFRRWETRLASVDTNRVVRPFEWGLDWLRLDPQSPDPRATLLGWARDAVVDSDTFFSAPPTTQYTLTDDVLRFPSAVTTPSTGQQHGRGAVFRADPRRSSSARRAVVVLPQWNSDSEGPRRAVQAVRAIRHHRAAAQPALSRRTPSP
jgi:rhodanese-related sulfurtransferase